MPDPQLTAQPSDPIHTKLLDVDLELAAQEAELIAQLEVIQEKRKGLKTVMGLFSPANIPAAETTSKSEPMAEVLTAPTLESLPPTPTASEPELVAKVLTASPLEPGTSTPTAETQAAPAPLQGPSETPRPATRRRTNQSDKIKRAKQPSWQPYVRAEFGQTSLAELVAKILKREPIDFFGIPTMMQAIFVDEMPKAVWTQARNRVSNILAEGARKNKWYRDQAGQYSLSPAAMEASLL